MKFKSFLLSAALMTSITVVQTPKADAAALAMLSPALSLLVLGSTLMGCNLIGNCPSPKYDIKPLLYLGIILDKDTNTVRFLEISEDEAKAANLTQEEKLAYEDELDRINGAFEEMNAAVSDSKSKKTGQIALENFKGEISPEAFSAVQKIVSSNR